MGLVESLPLSGMVSPLGSIASHSRSCIGSDPVTCSLPCCRKPRRIAWRACDVNWCVQLCGVACCVYGTERSSVMSRVPGSRALSPLRCHLQRSEQGSPFPLLFLFLQPHLPWAQGYGARCTSVSHILVHNCLILCQGPVTVASGIVPHTGAWVRPVTVSCHGSCARCFPYTHTSTFRQAPLATNHAATWCSMLSAWLST
jgi:hypothetical protein